MLILELLKPKQKLLYKIFASSFALGQLCSFRVSLCSCEPETCTLLRYELWPATPERPQMAFSIALLELFHYLSLECQVSVERFCNMLRWKNNLSLAEVIYDTFILYFYLT